MEIRTFSYGGIPVEYNLFRKNVKNVNIRISRNGEINVSANEKVSIEEITRILTDKAEWIIGNLASMEQKKDTKLSQLNGRAIRILGEEKKIHVIEGAKYGVLEEEDEIKIQTPDIYNENANEKKYQEWLKARALNVFDDVANRLLTRLPDIAKPDITVRKMKSRWGSCSFNQNKITLNLLLLEVPERLIEQVIMHELIHLKFHDHGKDFHDLLKKLMPDYKERKKELEKSF